MTETTVIDAYLDSLPEDRRETMRRVRDFILQNLPEGYEEVMQGTMIGYVVPHSLFPAGYHCNPKQPLGYMALACGKNYYSLHMMALYGDPKGQAWLEDEFSKQGKKLNMGKACIRFKSLDDLVLAPLGETIAKMTVEKYVSRYEGALQARKSR